MAVKQALTAYAHGSYNVMLVVGKHCAFLKCVLSQSNAMKQIGHVNGSNSIHDSHNTVLDVGKQCTFVERVISQSNDMKCAQGS